MTAEPSRPRTLTEALRGWTPDELARLLRHRPDLAAPTPRDLAELASRSTLGGSVGRALDLLDLWQRTVAEALAAMPDPTSTGELAALLDQPLERVAPTVQDLRERALVWGDAEQLHLVRPVREAFEPYPGGLAPPSSRPMDPDQVRAALAASSPGVRPVLDRLAWSPAGTVRRADRVVSPDQARSPIEELLARSLLRPVDSDTVLLPREVAWELRDGRFTAEEVPTTSPELTGATRDPSLLDRAGAGAAYGLLHDVELAVHALDTTPHRLLRTGGLATRDVATLARNLGTDAAYAVFVLELAAAAGLLDTANGSAVLPTTDYDRWAARPGALRWRQLASAWRDATRFFGRAAAPGAHALGSEGDAPAAPVLRATVLGLLHRAGAGRVVDAAELAAATAWHRPRLARGAEEVRPVVDWTWREAGWLGLAALGAVTSFAAPVATGEPLPRPLAALFPDPIERFVIQADLTAVAPGPLTHTVSAELRLLADQESRGGGGVFRFSEASLRRALDAGWTSEDVRSWLERHSTTGLPQPLAYLVEDAGRKHGRVRVGHAAAFLRTDDETQLAALLSHPQAAALGLRTLAPGVVVAAVEPEELVGLLRDVGLSPVVEDARGEVVTTPVGQRVSRHRPEPAGPPPNPDQVAATLVAAERSHPVRSAAATEETLQRLRTATRDAVPVRVTYVGADGSPTERELAPLDLAAGAVRAVDRVSAQVVTIPLARISAVSPA